MFEQERAEIDSASRDLRQRIRFARLRATQRATSPEVRLRGLPVAHLETVLDAADKLPDLVAEVRRAHELIVKIWDLAPSNDHRIADAIRQANYGGMIFTAKDAKR